jgi:hypothetical protein
VESAVYLKDLLCYYNSLDNTVSHALIFIFFFFFTLLILSHVMNHDCHVKCFTVAESHVLSMSNIMIIMNEEYIY